VETNERESVDNYFQLMAERGRSPGNLRFYISYLFRDVDLRGKTILDVGAGDGRYSLYAASAGAASVVSLEPETAGSRRGTGEAFMKAAEHLQLDQVQLVPERLQDYEPGDTTFDVQLLHSSINHLDEDACTRLHNDSRARNVYLGILRKLAATAAPGAKLIAVDCSRRNLFAHFGRNPLAPSIEWEKHQPPELWARLLEEVGFRNPKIRWNSFNTLRSMGRLLLGNRIASYCLTSSFCLSMERHANGPSPQK
jgi:SAM-dependent methyltransferase